jgi:hypothetical protein
VLKRRRRGNGIYASLFGVGAPEALVIGVVALLVFGPKGLAEVNLAQPGASLHFLCNRFSPNSALSSTFEGL